MYCQKPSKYEDQDILGMEDRPPVCAKPFYKPEKPTKGFPVDMEKTLRK